MSIRIYILLIFYFTINHRSISLVLYVAKSMASVCSKYLNTFINIWSPIWNLKKRVRLIRQLFICSYIISFSYFVKNIIVTIIFMRVSFRSFDLMYYVIIKKHLWQMFDKDWFSRSIIKIISYVTKSFKLRHLNSNPLHASYYFLCYYYNGYIED